MSPSQDLNPQPPFWGHDELSDFFDAARSNAFATSHHYRDWYRRMVDIDALYLNLFQEFKDPEEPLGATLAFRCHSALRAAAQLGLSGQIPETFMLLRGVLELALYSYHASTSDERSQIWMDRHETVEARRRSSAEFTPRVMFPLLRARAQAIGDAAGELYERTIDYGAHPNARGVLTSLTIMDTEVGQSFDVAYLTGSSLHLQLAMKSWSQIAVCSMDIFGLVFPKRFAELNLGKKLAPLRMGL